ncbi:type II toxin-antitoxin system VapC family toxin [Glaciibacter superstes]|uniref:type II toxin-antitoxin system VapC family toxin n=1 Tax=Glaciibacter superstes TaxID=501023 RepID=UPI0003B2E685|nr:type II toxin-antitoxin system VapC family toxin [Glaciibacter superstes]
MTEQAILLDSAIAIYALGEDHRYRDVCRGVMNAAAKGAFRPYASVEMIQELVHHRLRRTGDRSLAAADGRDVSAVCTLLNFDREVLDLSMSLIERIPTIRGRDAVHAASALVYGIERIVSPDRAFDGIPGLTRVDPADFEQTLASSPLNQ